MRTIQVLLGNCEGLLSDYLEALLVEVCGHRAAIECTRSAWLEDFRQQSSSRHFDLVILIPTNLRSETGEAAALNRGAAVLHLIRDLKSRASSPVLALTLADHRAHDEPLLLEAGTDSVLGLPFAAEAMKSVVRRLLRVPASSQAPSNRPWLWCWPPMAAASSPLASS